MDLWGWGSEFLPDVCIHVFLCVWLLGGWGRVGEAARLPCLLVRHGSCGHPGGWIALLACQAGAQGGCAWRSACRHELLSLPAPPHPPTHPFLPACACSRGGEEHCQQAELPVAEPGLRLLLLAAARTQGERRGQHGGGAAAGRGRRSPCPALLRLGHAGGGSDSRPSWPVLHAHLPACGAAGPATKARVGRARRPALKSLSTPSRPTKPNRPGRRRPPSCPLPGPQGQQLDQVPSGVWPRGPAAVPRNGRRLPHGRPAVVRAPARHGLGARPAGARAQREGQVREPPPNSWPAPRPPPGPPPPPPPPPPCLPAGLRCAGRR